MPYRLTRGHGDVTVVVDGAEVGCKVFKQVAGLHVPSVD